MDKRRRCRPNSPPPCANTWTPRRAQRQAERERQYLLHLCVDPDFRRWEQRYVALSGGYRVLPELTPAFSAIRVLGEGPQRQIERVPLPDIRTALDRHPVFILLAQPGAGKTTVLQRIALDKALACLQPGPTALARPCPSLCGWPPNRPANLPRTSWRACGGKPCPAAASMRDSEVREALRKGRLCLLVDALNEARREQYTERMHDWRDFAAGLPAGNQLVFSCRQLDYNGELAVQQVEIDPLDEGQIQEFAVRYLDEARGRAFWRTLHDRHADLLELAPVPYYLHMLVEVYEAQRRSAAPPGAAFRAVRRAPVPARAGRAPRRRLDRPGSPAVGAGDAGLCHAGAGRRHGGRAGSGPSPCCRRRWCCRPTNAPWRRPRKTCWPWRAPPASWLAAATAR